MLSDTLDHEIRIWDFVRAASKAHDAVNKSLSVITAPFLTEGAESSADFVTKLFCLEAAYVEASQTSEAVFLGNVSFQHFLHTCRD